MNILNLLASDGFITINKSLLKTIGLDATLIMGELASEYLYRERTNTLDNGFFYSTLESIEDSTTLTRYQQDQAIKLLVDIGFIEYKVSGMPAKRYFKINEDTVCKWLTNKIVKNSQTSLQKTDKQVCKKLTTNNNTLNNNTKNKNRDIITPLSPTGKRKSKKDQNLDTLTELMGGYNFSQTISAKLVEWYTYKAEQGKVIVPTGMKAQLTQVKNKIESIGEDKVIYVLEQSMANNYLGMIWDLANNKAKKSEARMSQAERFLNA